MSRLVNARRVTLACVISYTSFSAAGHAQSVVVVAVADDVQRIIVRNADESLVSYAKGDSIAGSDWRVVRVSRGDAVLEAVGRYNGSHLELKIEAGQSIELTAPRTEPNRIAPRSVIDVRSEPHMLPGKGG